MRQDAKKNRVKLLRAARDLFLQSGSEVPLEQIAARAEVGVATLYRHFADRAGLHRAVLLVALRDHVAAARAVREASVEPGETLALFLRRLLALRIPAIVPMLLPLVPAQNDTQINLAAADMESAVNDIVQRAKEVGALSARYEGADILALLARISRPIPGRSSIEDDLDAARHLDVVLRGLRPSTRQGWTAGQRHVTQSPAAKTRPTG